MNPFSSRLSGDATSDIQGFVTSGYGHLLAAAYLFLRVIDAAACRRWIGTRLDTIATAAPWPRDDAGRWIKPATAVNIAFTAGGLRACGLPLSVLCTFPLEFQEGIVTPARSRILGDTEESAPASWELGGPNTEPIHVVVVIHARDEAALDAACSEERSRIERTNGGVVEASGPAQRGYRPATDTEPFGFKDGLEQPSIAGLSGEGVPTGEFILGYPNHYGVIPPTPLVPSALDPQHLLPPFDNPYHGADRRHDLGRHGSFVVYRKLQQHVAMFWRALRDEAVRQHRVPEPGYMIWLASKMIGRWPSGVPLVQAPHRDDPERPTNEDFGYRGDPDGLACPIGAHIRRARPRDDLKPYPAEQSRHMSDAHRLLRRARVFGPPLLDPALLREGVAPGDRKALLSLEDDGQARGIHFFAVNASIRSQFEFVQQTWCNNAGFGGLSSNKDPIAGDHARAGDVPTRMVIPGTNGPLRTAPLPRFVTVRGGAYLFMPGLAALRYLAAGSFA
jgi:Dyp-type peroxidase family